MLSFIVIAVLLFPASVSVVKEAPQQEEEAKLTETEKADAYFNQGNAYYSRNDYDLAISVSTFFSIPQYYSKRLSSILWDMLTGNERY